MKKLFLILILAVGSSLAITSCTENEPQLRPANGGGGASDPILP